MCKKLSEKGISILDGATTIKKELMDRFTVEFANDFNIRESKHFYKILEMYSRPALNIGAFDPANKDFCREISSLVASRSKELFFTFKDQVLEYLKKRRLIMDSRVLCNKQLNQ